MTGAGRDPARSRVPRLPCPRPRGGVRTPARLLVLTCAPAAERAADPDGSPPTVAAELIDRLDGADVVFTTPACEATVLFYAEAWRVERLDGDVAPLTAWLAAHPGASGVLVIGDDPADTAVLDELAALPGLRVRLCVGPALVPPRSHPLGWGA